MGLALGLVVGGLAIAHRVTTPRDSLATVDPGGLNVLEAATGEWSLGSAAVVLDRHGLTVTQGSVIVWESVADEAFVTGASGEVSWREHRGYFWPEVRLGTQFADQRVESAQLSGQELILRGTLAGSDDEVAYMMSIATDGDDRVVMDIRADDRLNVIGLHSARTDHAGVHGFGAQYAEFDLDGRLLPIVIREQGVGRGVQPLTFLADLTEGGAGGTSQMTYAAMASFVTDDLRGVSLDGSLPESHSFAIADMRSGSRVSLHLWAPRMRAVLTGASSPAALVAAQQRSIDRPALNSWTQHGAIVGLQGGTEIVRRHLDQLHDAGTQVAAVWLQDWTGQRTTDFGDRLWWTWQLDRQRYPAWEQLLSDLADQGIRTTTYVNPFLVDAADKAGDPIRNLWAEAREAGYLVRTPRGEPYLLDQGGFSASLVDLTNPEAKQWFSQVIAEEVLGHGVAGFMADFAEGLPFDAVLAEGDAATMHNAWPKLWAQTVAEACRLADQPDCVTWFRSASLGMPGESALWWTGDQLVDFSSDDGLASALLGTFSAGVSGLPLVHSDIGGYTSIDAVVHDYVRSEELLRRWSEFSAFGVVFRTHEGNRPAANLQVYDSASTREAFARMSRVFAALAPYREQVILEAQRSGVPAIRHGWLAYPGTPAAEVDTQFFLGQAILVAPVLHAGADSVQVSFPPGRWRHLLTGETFEGGRTVSVSAPLGSPAAFVFADDPRAEEVFRAVQTAVA